MKHGGDSIIFTLGFLVASVTNSLATFRVTDVGRESCVKFFLCSEFCGFILWQVFNNFVSHCLICFLVFTIVLFGYGV